MARPVYRDDVELEPFKPGDDVEGPDSPLPLDDGDYMLYQYGTPRWLLPRTSRWQLYVQKAIVVLRPRSTWKYILASLVSLYVFYCFIRASPLFASRLPEYTGKYDVGTIDLEIPLDKPKLVSSTQFKDGSGPAFQLETVLFSLYYPAVQGAKSGQRHPWIPKPISLKAAGYARVLHVDNFIVRPLFTFALWMIAGGIDIPAQVDVPIFEADDKKDQDSFPVMVFSHGMISSRIEYSTYAGELASRGHVVALIEHRDGSSPGTTVKSKDGKERKLFYFTQKQLRSEPEMDVETLKKEQLAFRQAEIEEAISVLRRVGEGSGKELLESNLREEGHCLHNWSGRLNMTQLVIAGHSYGATGALQALNGAPKSTTRPAVGGIILDPGKSSGKLETDIDVPILVVNSNSWSSEHTMFHGRPHFDTVKDLVQGVLDRVGASWFVTSLGTSHPSVTDAPLIEPLLLSWTTGATINVKDGVREYVRVSAEFFQYLKNGTRTGVLAAGVTHEEYSKGEIGSKKTDKSMHDEGEIGSEKDDRPTHEEFNKGEIGSMKHDNPTGEIGSDTNEEYSKGEIGSKRHDIPKDVAKYWQIHVAPKTT